MEEEIVKWILLIFVCAVLIGGLYFLYKSLLG
jgi:hypothetical protein